jgi:predicted metal-dependent hydrolase
MNTERRQIVVGGLPVQIVRKAIKNLHLGVYPPNGRVRVAAPLAVSDHAVRLAVVGKLGWIKRQRARFADQPRQSRRELVSGETHYFLGRRYRLRVIEHQGRGLVVLRGRTTLELWVQPGSSASARDQVLQRWYRDRLRELVPPLLAKWEPILGVHAADWRIKKMKTKWGACSVDARRIWLNLELAKKPARCLEYLVVHELVHLVERRHNEHFTQMMDQHLPLWRQRRQELNSAPLAHADWSY